MCLNKKEQSLSNPKYFFPQENVQTDTFSIFEIFLYEINKLKSHILTLCRVEGQDESFLPLCLSSKGSQEVKFANIIYNPKDLSYYIAKRLYKDELSQYLPLYFIEYSSTILFPEIIPENLINYQLKSFLSKEVWNKLADQTMDKYGHRCHICGVKDQDNMCDEKWVYYQDGVNGTSFFAGLYVYCKKCFIAKNYRNYNINILDKKALKHYRVSDNISFEEQLQLSALSRFAVMNKESIYDTLRKVKKYILLAEHYKNINWEVNFMILKKIYNIEVNTRNLTVRAI